MGTTIEKAEDDQDEFDDKDDEEGDVDTWPSSLFLLSTLVLGNSVCKRILDLEFLDLEFFLMGFFLLELK